MQVRHEPAPRSPDSTSQHVTSKHVTSNHVTGLLIEFQGHVT